MTTLTMTAQPECKRRQVDAALGMAVFIGSWSMGFATLFLSFLVLRHREPTWPPPGVALPSLPLAAAATGVLLLSSLVLHRAVLAGRAGRGGLRGLPGLWAAGLLLALVFAGLQSWLWMSLWRAGGRPDAGMYAALFYMLTWFHALHVACGLVALGMVQAGALLGRIGPARLSPAASTAVFWHFVDALWIVLFLSFFVF